MNDWWDEAQLEAEPSPELSVAIRNPDLPNGGRAAVGTLSGIAFTALAIEAYEQLSKKDTEPSRKYRATIAALYLVAGATGAAAASPPGTKRAAATGAAVGVALSQAPIICAPRLLEDHPVLDWIWQLGIPTAMAVLGANIVKDRP